jgi:cation transport ATPase
VFGAPAAHAAAAAADGGARMLLVKAAVSLLAGVAAMLLAMPAMAPAGPDAHLTAADPFMRWSAEALGPWLQRTFPWVYALPAPAVAWSLLVVTAIVMAWAGGGFYVRAWRNLRHGTSDMNTLVAVGTGAAFVYSAAATIAPGAFVRAGVAPDLYYEAALFIVALVLAGRALEASRPAPNTRPRERCPASSPCSRRRRGCAPRTGARPIARLPRWASATSRSCGRGSGCRWTGSWPRAGRPWTKRC